jgi:CysZ protein
MDHRMILTDFSRALGQLFDPRFRRVLFLGVALTIALLVAVYALFIWFMAGFVEGPINLPLVGEVGWIGDLLGWASIFLLIFFSMFLMLPVASAITSLFLDDVAQAVEEEFYPGVPPAGRVSFADGLMETVGFLAVLIVANIVALFLYVLFPFLTPVIFYGMNGYLLGREYFLLAAIRHEGRASAKVMLAANRGQIWLAGCLMAVPLSIPLMNLFIPVLGAATFTHLYHRLNGTVAVPVRRY